jgi:Protein of unknown function (DUF3306)
MSGEEDFLKRWSRRKREAADAPPAAKPDDAAATTPGEKPAESTEAVFDPASLPPIDSITALSDITAFLRAGVPAELTRAALRRVWTADPAIRDFVGLAENAWDFTDPNAMPGFGPLESTEEVRRMIAGIVERIGEAARPAVAEAAPESGDVSNDSSAIGPAESKDERPAQVASLSDHAGEKPAEVLGSQVMLQGNTGDTAMQREVAETPEKPEQLSRRTHGGALPR